MKYCTRCLYPDTKPDLTFDDLGVCSACQAFDARTAIDWDVRMMEFQRVVIDTKSEAAERNAPYDCVVPVSGGKDSHYQILTALDWGLKVLAVTAETDHLSDIGRRNLDNISRLGVDHIEVKTNPIIRREINRYTLEIIGDISWAEHITIFSIPIRIASMMRIPLIIWGENPQNEYGGPAKAQTAIALTQDWLNEFGGLNGLRVDDVETAIGPIGELYRHPGDVSVNGIFLGQFFPWDGMANAKKAMERGFEVVNQHHVEGSYGNYENLDNYQTGIHDYFKYLKFGFGRATDILSNHIRRGKITRQDAIPIVAERDGAFPAFYLGKPLKEILKPLWVEIGYFLEICDTFTNQSLFDGSHVRGDIRPKFNLLERSEDGQDSQKA
jgi:N-acetyl sugar amidotransferase